MTRHRRRGSEKQRKWWGASWEAAAFPASWGTTTVTGLGGLTVIIAPSRAKHTETYTPPNTVLEFYDFMNVKPNQVYSRCQWALIKSSELDLKCLLVLLLLSCGSTLANRSHEKWIIWHESVLIIYSRICSVGWGEEVIFVNKCVGYRSWQLCTQSSSYLQWFFFLSVIVTKNNSLWPCVHTPHCMPGKDFLWLVLRPLIIDNNSVGDSEEDNNAVVKCKDSWDGVSSNLSSLATLVNVGKSGKHITGQAPVC